MEQKAKIFLADERGVTHTEWFRSYNTFNFGNYKTEHKIPVEKLYVCNDDTLAAGKSLAMMMDEITIIILLPVVGAVEFKNNSGETTLVNCGQVFSITLQKGDSFTIVNPYTDELVNFLQLWIKPGENKQENYQLHSFNIDTQKNSLVKIPYTFPFIVAKFDGRSELVYKTGKENNCVFAFVIQGAFELEGILLHQRDGVALWNYQQVEMEALSNDAIIVVLEMSIAA